LVLYFFDENKKCANRSQRTEKRETPIVAKQSIRSIGYPYLEQEPRFYQNGIVQGIVKKAIAFP